MLYDLNDGNCFLSFTEASEFYTTTYAAPTYYTTTYAAPSYYTTTYAAPTYYTTTFAAPTYYAEAPKYYTITYASPTTPRSPNTKHQLTLPLQVNILHQGSQILQHNLSCSY